MTRLSIPLETHIVLPDLPEMADKRMIQHEPFLAKLGEAIESERGIKLTYASRADAEGQRLKFYRARRYVSRQGIKSFEALTLIIEGNAILIKKDLPPEVEQL